MVAWSEPFVATWPPLRVSAPVGVHVKLDTGMGRLGTRDRDEALRVAECDRRHRRRSRCAGAMTHFATADGDRDFMLRQLEAFVPFADELRAACPGTRGARREQRGDAAWSRPAHFDMVRCGIAIYGCDPMNEDPDEHGLEPALELSSYVAAVKTGRSGRQRRATGGVHRRAPDDGSATLPIGYADGVRRALSNNCDVLIGGRRYPLGGTVSMDNITVDLGPSPALESATGRS